MSKIKQPISRKKKQGLLNPLITFLSLGKWETKDLKLQVSGRKADVPHGSSMQQVP